MKKYRPPEVLTKVQSVPENRRASSKDNVDFLKLTLKRSRPLRLLTPPPSKRSRQHDPCPIDEPASTTEAQTSSLSHVVPGMNAAANTSCNLPKKPKFTKEDLITAVSWASLRKRPASREEDMESWRTFSMKVSVILVCCLDLVWSLMLDNPASVSSCR